MDIKKMLVFRSFVTFCYLRVTFQAPENGGCREERSQRGFALLNSTYSSKTVESYPACVNLCFHDPRCLSLNFWWYTRKCDLNNKVRQRSRRDCFVAELSSIYMGMAKLLVNKATSCSDLKKNDPSAESGDYVIDSDGEGGLSAFVVTCDMSDKNGVGVTVISHDSESRTLVNGCDGAGCYSRNIRYAGASLSQLASLIGASLHCEQFIKYECKGSSFVYGGGRFGWWVSRDNANMKYWGGASPDSGKTYKQVCACGMTDSCANPSYGCNCDKNDGTWREDSGLLTDKTHLPVKQLRFGDTAGELESGYHTLGKFKCYGIANY